MKFPLLMAFLWVVGSVATPVDQQRLSAAFALDDRNQPVLLEKVGHYHSVGNVWDVARLGHYLYLVTEDMTLSHGGSHSSATLTVLDISDPTAPSTLSRYPLLANARHIQVGGAFTYVASVESNRGLPDFADPFKALPPIPVNLYHIAPASTYAFVTGAADASHTSYAVQIVDVARPYAPQLVAALGLPARIWDVVIAGDTAYVAAGAAGLQVIATTPDEAATVIAQVDVGSPVQAMTVVGDTAYVTDNQGRLHVLDLRNPRYPRPLGVVAMGSVGQQVVIAGNYALVAAGLGGLRVVDISDPFYPVEVEFFDTPGYALAVAVVGDLIYVADQSAGLLLLRFNVRKIAQ